MTDAEINRFLRVTPSSVFEDAIRSFGVVAACEWFGHASDSEFTQETIRVLEERAKGGQQ